MQKNVGITDRLLRLSAALVVAVLFILNTISGTTAVGLSVVALAMVVTSFVNFWSLYALLGINTCQIKRK